MTPAESRDARYRALADPVRRRILRLLDDSPEACDVETLAGSVHLHPNTVRGHLVVLEQAELVVRSTRPRTTPGRPRVVYAAVDDPFDTAGSGYRLLAELLTATVRSSADDPARAAEEAGHSWGKASLGELSGDDVDPRVAEERLTALLEAIGFEPRSHRDGDRTVIELNDCPFRDLAREHSDVVCSLHLGLMHGATEALGGTDLEQFQPFAEPSLCRTVIVSRPQAD